MRSLLALIVLGASSVSLADGPADNVPAKVRPVPRAGIAVPDEVRKTLEEGVAKLADRIAAIEVKGEAKLSRFLPDVRIFHKAVHDALAHNEFFRPEEFAKAQAHLSEGMERANALLDRGEAPWTKQVGSIALGYISKIDGSVQPYDLLIPESWEPKGPHRFRLDIWFHGRMEELSEVNFLGAEHVKRHGVFEPEDTFVLHPYGRFCNAFKFAGEVDVLEALDDVKTRYKIDEDRISERGFSMGGAAAWHFAVHYPGEWFAANPGAGFSETPRFLNVFQNEKVEPTDYEKTLWQLYDCNEWARNLVGCPTIAYSGELDTQKQAADVMAEAMAEVDLPLAHIIGPKTKHQYEKGAKSEVVRRMEALAARGRPRVVDSVDFTTFTLRYNTMRWLTIDAVDRHWEPARALVEIYGDEGEAVISVDDAENVSALTIRIPAGGCPAPTGGGGILLIDDEEFEIDGPLSDLSWNVSLHRENDDWKLGTLPGNVLRKTHGLQGPIDDAFLDAFAFVMPTGESKNPQISEWVKSESDRAVKRWRTQFRGDARVKVDKDVTDADIASMNLVLWGDPQSNAILARIADKMPIRWEGDSIVVGDTKYSAADHVPILILPNPLNPEKYVVLNSGFTYREYDDLNNARQVPKLPDWAIVNVRTPPSSRYPGKVVAADFFDEVWKIRAKAD